MAGVVTPARRVTRHCGLLSALGRRRKKPAEKQGAVEKFIAIEWASGRNGWFSLEEYRPGERDQIVVALRARKASAENEQAVLEKADRMKNMVTMRDGIEARRLEQDSKGELGRGANDSRQRPATV